MKPENSFTPIFDTYIKSNKDVSEGKMMNAPGLKYNGKIFVFYHKNKMGFRLGPEFDPSSFRLTTAEPLSPFKTKPPLKGWFLINESESFRWDELTSIAFEYTKTIK